MSPVNKLALPRRIAPAAHHPAKSRKPSFGNAARKSVGCISLNATLRSFAASDNPQSPPCCNPLNLQGENSKFQGSGTNLSIFRIAKEPVWRAVSTPHGFVLLVVGAVASRGTKPSQRPGNTCRGGTNAPIARIGRVRIRISAKAACRGLRANWISGA